MNVCTSVGTALVRRLTQADRSTVEAVAALAASARRSCKLPSVGPQPDGQAFEAQLRLRQALAEDGSCFVVAFGNGSEAVGGYCVWVAGPTKYLDHQVSVELRELAFAEHFSPNPGLAVTLLEKARQEVVGWLRSQPHGEHVCTFQLEVWVDPRLTEARALLEQVFTGGQCGFRDGAFPQVMLVRREPAAG